MRLDRRSVVRQGGRFAEVSDHVPPVVLGLPLILAIEPLQVIPEGPPWHQLGLPPTHKRRVVLANLSEHQTQAPAVQQDMMRGPHQEHLIVAQRSDDDA
jgi:hypothetical protein